MSRVSALDFESFESCLVLLVFFVCMHESAKIINRAHNVPPLAQGWLKVRAPQADFVLHVV